MISRALERDITQFIGLIESQLARLIHTFHEATKKLHPSEKQMVLRDAFVVAWRRREHFDPLAEPIHVWFERCIFVAQAERVLISPDEMHVLLRLSPSIAMNEFVPVASEIARTADPVLSKESVSTAVSTPREGLDAKQKLGKDCPPCWRCMYHQGWLPKRNPYKEGWAAKTEMDLICQKIDLRKFEIAHYVRANYDERLLEAK